MKTRCGYCRTRLRLSTTILAVYRGVLGHRGPVPLEDAIVLCDEQCLRDYFNGMTRPQRRGQ